MAGKVGHCGASREPRSFGSREKQLSQWQRLARPALRTCRARTKAVPHGAGAHPPHSRCHSPCLLLLIPHSSVSPRCAGKRSRRYLSLTPWPSFYNLSFLTSPLPMAALQPLGAAERSVPLLHARRGPRTTIGVARVRTGAWASVGQDRAEEAVGGVSAAVLASRC